MMKSKGTLACIGLALAFCQPMAHGMGLRSFVALPVEKGGSVLRGTLEHNIDTDTNQMTVNVAYGISHRKTLLFGVPYRFSSSGDDHLGDVGVLYRYITRQIDTSAGTDRLGLLGGVIVPTDGNRDAALQAGAVFTHFRDRNEFDLDVLYQQGLGNRANSARYDLSWQYRISPPEYPEWGIPREWYVVTELGGRWQENNRTVHQFTLGVQWVARRWVFEGGVVKDLNSPNQTRLLFSIRYH